MSEGHPDKVADQISDAVLDALLERDARSRVACETLVSTGLVVLAGEVRSKADVNYARVVRECIKAIGYDHVDKGFDYKSCSVLVAMDKQSPDIAMGVDGAKDQGAGDQGLMFGYAVDETKSFMPLGICLAHGLMHKLSKMRKAGEVSWLRPDSKAQVTMEYVNGRPSRVHTVVVSTQHSPDVGDKEIKECVREALIKKVVPAQWLKGTQFFINPTGRFVVGGPQGDCGLTGRKIIVDTYGGYGAHGGGAFSGKDPSKVDRSAAYAARHIAKNIVAAGLARRCLVQLAYAIGVARPVSVMVEDFGTGPYGGELLGEVVQSLWDLSPRGIIESLDLLKPRYQKTAVYGHFGRSEESFSWERLDMVEALQDAVGGAQTRAPTGTSSGAGGSVAGGAVAAGPVSCIV